MIIEKIATTSNENEYITWFDVNGREYGMTHDSKKLLDQDGQEYLSPSMRDLDIKNELINIVGIKGK